MVSRYAPAYKPANSSRSSKLWWLTVPCLAVASYGWYAGYGNGYDAGRASCIADKSDAEYHRGLDAGRKLAAQELSMENQGKVQEEVQRQVAEQASRFKEILAQSTQAAFEQGKAAEAKMVIDHDLSYYPKKASPKEEKK